MTIRWASGDIIFMDEVNPVMKKLEESGIEITALHNHLLRAEPMTLFMHVLGHGDPSSSQPRCIRVRSAKHRWGMPDPRPRSRRRRSKSTSIPRQQFSIPRAEPTTEDGMDVPEAMGSAIGINFQPTGGGKAAITGDFVLSSKEVNPVIRAMQANGIEITALHSHMLDEQLRAALDNVHAQARLRSACAR